MADTPSSQYSIYDVADLSANLPHSNGDQQQQSSDEGFFDVDILIHKLQAYKASVEDAEAQIRRKRSINPREVSEVTAAARLKLRLDGRPPASSRSHDNSVLTSPTALNFPSSASSNASSSPETSYFDPITPEEHEVPYVAFANNTNRDTWKSSHSVSISVDKGTVYDESTRPIAPPRSPARFGKTSTHPIIKILGNKSTVSSPLASPVFLVPDKLSVPSTSSSLTTSEVGEGTRKSMTMCPPDEDRIRREIETYTIKDWDTEELKKLEVIALSKESGQVQVVPSDGSDAEDLYRSRTAIKPYPQHPTYGYSKATFREKVGSIWHRRTKADKIIDLYYEMDITPKEKMVRTWTTRKTSSNKLANSSIDR